MKDLAPIQRKCFMKEIIKQISKSVIIEKGYESKINNKDAINEITSILKNEIFKDNNYLKISFSLPTRYEITFKSIDTLCDRIGTLPMDVNTYDIDGLFKEIELTYKRLEDWKNSITKNSGLKVEDTIKKLQLENQKLKKEIEYLKKNLPKRKTFSSSQIQAIKNMNIKGISIKLIAMEFNCKIEDIQNVIDNI